MSGANITGVRKRIQIILLIIPLKNQVFDSVETAHRVYVIHARTMKIVIYTMEPRLMSNSLEARRAGLI